MRRKVPTPLELLYGGFQVPIWGPTPRPEKSFQVAPSTNSVRALSKHVLSPLTGTVVGPVVGEVDPLFEGEPATF